jgi:murein DD-endopeptidase MepM/ murein hydrolase activator NlpD
VKKTICIVLTLLLLVSCAHVPKQVEADKTIKPKQVITKQPPPKKKQNLELLFPVKGAYISSEFGGRNGTYHRGVDLAASLGTPVRACSDGKVISSGRVKFLTGYGNAILLSHGNGVFTYYAHLHTLKVSRGNMVNRGEVIGTVGNTGKSNGPHLHLELIIHDKNHNPVPYFFIDNSVTTSAMLWLKGVKKSVATGLGLKKLIGDW